jgi:hypothetical protein
MRAWPPAIAVAEIAAIARGRRDRGHRALPALGGQAGEVLCTLTACWWRRERGWSHASRLCSRGGAGEGSRAAPAEVAREGALALVPSLARTRQGQDAHGRVAPLAAPDVTTFH